MTDKPHAPVTVEQVLQDIVGELQQTTPFIPPMVRRFAQLRTLAEWARVPRQTGRFVLVKDMLHRLSRANLNRQFDINEAILTLVEDLTYEFDRYRVAQEKKHLEFLQRLGSVVADDIESPPGSSPRQCGAPQSAKDCQAEHTSLRGLAAISGAPAEMLPPERAVLYSLVRGLSPGCCLEIGTFRGGAAVIICAALDDNDHGQLVCVDPAPRITGESWRRIMHRATLCTGSSPAALAEAARIAGEPFDFALIDGDHTTAGVLADIEGVLPLLADRAYLLFHDCHYHEVEAAVHQALQEHAHQLIDCGVVSVEEKQQAGEWAVVAGKPVKWGGLRLLRFLRHAP